MNAACSGRRQMTIEWSFSARGRWSVGQAALMPLAAFAEALAALPIDRG
jgi:hypothetical protein